MRKMMTKEVTFTVLKIAKLEVQEGKPVVIELPDEIILGTINPEKAQKRVNKLHRTNVTILSQTVETKTYEMPVEEFIKVAKVQGENPDTTEIDNDNENEEQTPEPLLVVTTGKPLVDRLNPFAK